MFGKSTSNSSNKAPDSTTPSPLQMAPNAHSASGVESSNTISTIGSGFTITGKIVGEGVVKILGRIEGELRASTVQISDGAHVEGDIFAEEVNIGGRVKGTLHANRVKLNSTAVVEGDIFHRTLVIEENARFEGSSRREENVIDLPSSTPANRRHPQVNSASLDKKVLDKKGNATSAAE